MSLAPTRRRLALWGQRLCSYLPPFSPAGLVGGHAMLRYAVSGDTASTPLTTTTSVHSDDCSELRFAQLRARLSSSTSLPSSAPVEVVWNANDATPFHHVTPASPEDVALCTEYLVRQSWAAAQSSPPPSAAAAAAATASLPVDDTVNDLLQTVATLRSALQAHRSLLAGAESLQTGLPLSILLGQLAEADAYLEWSHAISERLPKESRQASAASMGCARAEERVGEGKGKGADAAAAEAEAQRRRALRGDFEREVCCLRHELSRCAFSALRRSAMTSSPISATVTRPLDEEDTAAWADRTLDASLTRPPLVTVVTSTHNSLASALKAAAVTWAATRRGPYAQQYHNHHHHYYYPSPILWHPAAETALSAVWLMVLLRGCLPRATPVQDQQQQQHPSASTPATAPLVQGNREERRSEERGAKREQLSARLFNVLLTGGDTSVHLVAPWVAGVRKACATVPDPCPIRVKGGGAETCSSSGSSNSASLLDQQQTTETFRFREPLLLCYGCPGTQVGDLCAALGRLAHSAQHPSGGSERSTVGGGYSVVELRTEMPTTGLLLPATPAITDEPTFFSAVAVTLAREGVEPSLQTVAPVTAASSLTLLHTYSSSSTSTPRDECVTVAALPTLEAAAQHVFDWSVLEPPFLRRRPAAVRPSSPSFRVGPDLGATPSSSLPLFPPSHSCMLVPGWCSLYFVDEVHAPTLLRLLVQRHWKEPLYMGHSLVPSSRRGPLPSQAHTLQLQAALKSATRGTRGPEKKIGVMADGEEGALGPPWQQVCGGFALPLTALAGRSSPYLLPCLLVSDLASVMSAEEQQDLAAHLSYYAPTTRTRAGKVEEGRHRDAANRRLAQAAQRAVINTQRRLHAFVQHFDSAERGYRGVVSGNVLCICRYPAPLTAAVKAAVMTGEVEKNKGIDEV